MTLSSVLRELWEKGVIVITKEDLIKSNSIRYLLFNTDKPVKIVDISYFEELNKSIKKSKTELSKIALHLYNKYVDVVKRDEYFGFTFEDNFYILPMDQFEPNSN